MVVAPSEPDSALTGYVTTVVGAVIGSIIGGLLGIQLGTSMLDEPTRTSENVLDDLFVVTFEAIFGLLVVAAVTVAVLCIGVAVGAYVALRVRKLPLAGATSLLCLVFDVGAVPAAFYIAITVDEIAPAVSELAGLAVLVLAVPLAARWITTRFTTAQPQNPL